MPIKKEIREPATKAEHETVLLYDEITDTWQVETNIAKHIRRFLPAVDRKKLVILGESKNGQDTYLRGQIDPKMYKIKLFKRYQISDQRREELRQIMTKMRKKQLKQVKLDETD